MKRIAALSAIGLAVVALASGAVQAQVACNAYDEQVQAINPVLDSAFVLMQDRKIEEGIALLPQLEQLLDALPASMPAPAQCGADIRVFDYHQLAEFQALQAAGKRIPGFAADAHFVSSDLPFASLAYSAGWLNYEKGDFARAREFYAKGLLIAPNEHGLVNEMLATLVQLKQTSDTITLADQFLAIDTDSDGQLRSNVLLSKAVALALEGDNLNAEIVVDDALALSPENENAMSLKNQLSLGT